MNLEFYLQGSQDESNESEDIILSNVIEGLQFLHGQGVVYKALKPSNGILEFLTKKKADA